MGEGLSGQAAGSLGVNSKCLLRDDGLYPEVWCKIAELYSYP